MRLKSGKRLCKAAGKRGKRTGNQPIRVEVFLHGAIASLAQE